MPLRASGMAVRPPNTYMTLTSPDRGLRLVAGCGDWGVARSRPAPLRGRNLRTQGPDRPGREYAGERGGSPIAALKSR